MTAILALMEMIKFHQDGSSQQDVNLPRSYFKKGGFFEKAKLVMNAMVYNPQSKEFSR